MNLIEQTKSALQFLNLTFSPIKNSPGNIEYLIYLVKKERDNNLTLAHINQIKRVVDEAHCYFLNKCL